MESELPNLGLVLMKDAESNQSVWIDTSNKKTREKFYTYRQEQKDKLEKQFKKLGMDYVSLLTTDDYTKALIKLFAKRERL